MKSVFISRKLEAGGVFSVQAAERNISVIDMPLINIVKIPFSYTPQTNWIFFTSKNAIRYFFEQGPALPAYVKYGVISESSAGLLMKYGKRADFTGEGVDLRSIARAFRDVLGNDSVLFPQAMDSLQTIQKQLAFTNTTYNLYTYKTILKTDFELPYTDVLVFTSPSNVRAYFSKYKIDSRQTVVAMGASTTYLLSEFGVKNVLTPREFSEAGLWETIAAAVIPAGEEGI
jgi:uroporphyrinogen-III synthase